MTNNYQQYTIRIHRHIGRTNQTHDRTADMANGRLDDREYSCDRYRHSAINIEIGFFNFLYEPGTTRHTMYNLVG